MRVVSITFNLNRSMPVEPLSGLESDRYASIRPGASVTIELDESEAHFWVEKPTEANAAKEIVQRAFDFAADRCLEQMKAIGDELRAIYKPDRIKTPPAKG